MHVVTHYSQPVFFTNTILHQFLLFAVTHSNFPKNLVSRTAYMCNQCPLNVTCNDDSPLHAQFTNWISMVLVNLNLMKTFSCFLFMENQVLPAKMTS